ncbi:MAG: hypothetical protein ACQESR_25425 [Planctomycetota bacterium]
MRVGWGANADVHAADGYAVTTHAYDKPGTDLVAVQHTGQRDCQATARLCVVVEEDE